MARIIRLLIISVSLLILPPGATPPVTGPCPMARSLVVSAGCKTLLIKKYLVLQRIGDERGTKARVRLYDITLLVTLDRGLGVQQQPASGPPEEFSTHIRTVRPANDQERVYGTPDCCPVLPML
jgi:hypothetical protein